MSDVGCHHYHLWTLQLDEDIDKSTRQRRRV
jgi:hypothetical protein